MILSEEDLIESAEMIYNFPMTIGGIKDVLWQICKAQADLTISEERKAIGEWLNGECDHYKGSGFKRIECGDCCLTLHKAILREERR